MNHRARRIGVLTAAAGSPVVVGFGLQDHTEAWWFPADAAGRH